MFYYLCYCTTLASILMCYCYVYIIICHMQLKIGLICQDPTTAGGENLHVSHVYFVHVVFSCVWY